MAKRRRPCRSYRRRARAFLRRRKPARLSLLTVAGMGAGSFATFAGAGDIGIAPQVIGAIKGEKDWKDVPRVLVRETLGYDYEYKKWSIPAFTALTLGGAIGSKIANRFVRPQTFDAIPFIGKKIKL